MALTNADRALAVKVGLLDAEEEGEAQISPNNVDGMGKEEEGEEERERLADSPKHRGVDCGEGDQCQQKIEELQGNAEQTSVHKNWKSEREFFNLDSLGSRLGANGEAASSSEAILNDWRRVSPIGRLVAS